MNEWLYATACVILPTLWGVAMVWVIGCVERFVRARRPVSSVESVSPAENGDAFRSLEYHI